MKCYLCGYNYLTRKNTVYAKHIYPYGNPKRYFEMVPLCRDCASKPVGCNLTDNIKLPETK